MYALEGLIPRTDSYALQGTYLPECWQKIFGAQVGQNQHAHAFGTGYFGEHKVANLSGTLTNIPMVCLGADWGQQGAW